MLPVPIIFFSHDLCVWSRSDIERKLVTVGAYTATHAAAGLPESRGNSENRLTSLLF